MPALSLLAPAKLNLFLAVTGRRPDGYHDLVSIAAPLEFGDELAVELTEAGWSLQCDDPELTVDDSNLVLKAARAFAAATGWSGGAKFFLRKRIPVGAGLGGGSSDAVAVLRALNGLTRQQLAPEKLQEVAAALGSDCPLFLAGRPVAMRGRGERVSLLPPGAERRLCGRRVLVFKPAFGISTPWAYAQMVARPSTYLPLDRAEARLARWIDDPKADVEAILFNNMEHVAFAKHLALPALLDELRDGFGLAPRMSGSGSACFALLPEEARVEPIESTIRAAWGEHAFVMATRISGPEAASRDQTINPH